MTHPALSLQAEIFSRLSQHVSLLSLMGGPFIYDDVPPKQEPPYIVFAESTHNDWSTGSEDGMEHFIALNVWSSQNGRKEVLLICEELNTALANFNDQLDGHHLVNFTHEVTQVGRDEDTGYFRGSVTFRAVTEPILDQ